MSARGSGMCIRYSFFGSGDLLKSSFGIEAVDSEPIASYNVYMS